MLLIDPDTAQRRLEQMERARMKLQEKHDTEAAKYAERQKIVCNHMELIDTVMK